MLWNTPIPDLISMALGLYMMLFNELFARQVMASNRILWGIEDSGPKWAYRLAGMAVGAFFVIVTSVGVYQRFLA